VKHTPDTGEVQRMIDRATSPLIKDLAAWQDKLDEIRTELHAAQRENERFTASSHALQQRLEAAQAMLTDQRDRQPQQATDPTTRHDEQSIDTSRRLVYAGHVVSPEIVGAVVNAVDDLRAQLEVSQARCGAARRERDRARQILSKAIAWIDRPERRVSDEDSKAFAVQLRKERDLDRFVTDEDNSRAEQSPLELITSLQQQFQAMKGERDSERVIAQGWEQKYERAWAMVVDLRDACSRFIEWSRKDKP
jgi:hypothetical protein